MYPRGLVLAGLLLSAVSPAWAVLGILWEFDRSYTPPPDAFLLTVTQSGAPPQQFRVALAAPGACLTLPTGEQDSFCTRLACPKPGTVAAFWVQAVLGEETSDLSNIATCWFEPGPQACACQDPARVLTQLLPPPPPPPDLTLIASPPPLPQRTADGLNLLPVGDIPPLPTLPPMPTSGGA
jgi:hypothetical protein